METMRAWQQEAEAVGASSGPYCSQRHHASYVELGTPVRLRGDQWRNDNQQGGGGYDGQQQDGYGDQNQQQGGGGW